MNSLRMILLGITACVAGFGAEFKLPEKFLVFDSSRIYSAVSSAAPMASRLPIAPTKTMDICAHIRIITPPSDLDPGISLPYTVYSQSKMPVLQPPPACQAKGR